LENNFEEEEKSQAVGMIVLKYLFRGGNNKLFAAIWVLIKVVCGNKLALDLFSKVLWCLKKKKIPENFWSSFNKAFPRMPFIPVI